MSVPFEPVGEVARWVPIYEHLRDLNPGDFVGYETLSELAGVDIQYDRSPFQQAEKKLLENNQRALKVERGEGYRVMHAWEHAEKAKDKTREADRRIKSAIKILKGTNYNELSDDQIARNEAVVGALTSVQDMTRRLSRRQDKLEETLKAVRRESKETTADLAERLSRLEAVLKGEPVSE